MTVESRARRWLLVVFCFQKFQRDGDARVRTADPLLTALRCAAIPRRLQPCKRKEKRRAPATGRGARRAGAVREDMDMDMDRHPGRCGRWTGRRAWLIRALGRTICALLIN